MRTLLQKKSTWRIIATNHRKYNFFWRKWISSPYVQWHWNYAFNVSHASHNKGYWSLEGWITASLFPYSSITWSELCMLMFHEQNRSLDEDHKTLLLLHLQEDYLSALRRRKKQREAGGQVKLTDVSWLCITLPLSSGPIPGTKWYSWPLSHQHPLPVLLLFSHNLNTLEYSLTWILLLCQIALSNYDRCCVQVQGNAGNY